MKFNYKLFAEKIKAQMWHQMSQSQEKKSLRDFAGQIGIGHVTFKRVMESKPASLDTILKICDWLKTPITMFIN